MIELAGCVILDEAGRLLLLHRATSSLTQWELPGGKIETGESPQDAASRELGEELGIGVDLLAELGSPIFKDHGRFLRYYWFLATISSGQPSPRESKFDAVKYFSVHDLAGRPDLSSNVRTLLKMFKDGFGPGATSKLRRIRNEIIIQQENTRIKNMATDLLDREAAHFLALSFACECANSLCKQTVAVTATEYTKIHDTPGLFAVAPGHQQPDIERVVEAAPTISDPHYLVVEKPAIKAGRVRQT